MLERILDTIDLYINSLQKDYPKALTDNLWQAIINLRKYSDSQPRDDHGRWTDGGGGDSSSSGGTVTANDIASNAHSRNTELEKMIQRCINEPQPVFADDLKRNFSKIPKERGKYITALHGTANSVYLFDMQVDDKVLANIIQSRKDYHGEEIILISCNTGNTSKGKNCFAQRLADRLNKIVYAPTSYGAISPNGKYFSANSKGTKKEGEFKAFIPKKGS